jgi:hypothetical protein
LGLSGLVWGSLIAGHVVVFCYGEYLCRVLTRWGISVCGMGSQVEGVGELLVLGGILVCLFRPCIPPCSGSCLSSLKSARRVLHTWPHAERQTHANRPSTSLKRCQLSECKTKQRQTNISDKRVDHCERDVSHLIKHHTARYMGTATRHVTHPKLTARSHPTTPSQHSAHTWHQRPCATCSSQPVHSARGQFGYDMHHAAMQPCTVLIRKTVRIA